MTYGGNQLFFKEELRPLSAVCSAVARLRFELHQERDDCFAERFDPRLLLRVRERSIRLERVVCLRHGDLVRQNDHTDVAEDRADVHQPSQTSQRTGRSAHQGGDLALVSDQGRLPRNRSRNPIDGILEDRRDRAVVFGRGNQQAVMADKQLFQLRAVFRYPVLGLKVLVEERQRKVPQVDQRDLAAGLPGSLDGDLQKLLVERFPAACCPRRREIRGVMLIPPF